MVRRTQSRGLGGSRVYKGAIRGRQNGNPGQLERQAGYNYREYRGVVLGKKQVGELRVAAFGGGTAYGFGVSRDNAWPYQLGQLLKEDGKNVAVANVGANSQGIYGVAYDVEAYDGILDYDIALIYNGYNDSSPAHLERINSSGWRSDLQASSATSSSCLSI